MPAQNAVFQVVPGKDDRGEHIFSAIVKRSYRFKSDGSSERLEVDYPLRLVDEYYDDGDPDWTTVKHESEVAPYKVATDVVVIGKAYAPRGAPTMQMTAGVRVGNVQKLLLVTGDRFCSYRGDRQPVFTDPVPFVEMEMRYERAYGGRDERSIPEIPFIYPRNSLGRGVVLRNVRELVEGLPLPNIEDQRDLLTPERVLIQEPDRWHLQPVPQGFGWRQRTWYPRTTLLGAYPPFLDPGTVTAEELMGLVPKDHVALAKQSRLKPRECRFAAGASIGLTLTDLKGNEPISLGGFTPNGAQSFSLPGDTPAIVIDLGTGEQQPRPQLHTVSIRPDDCEFDLIWRAAVTYEGYNWLPKMTRLHVEVS